MLVSGEWSLIFPATKIVGTQALTVRSQRHVPVQSVVGERSRQGLLHVKSNASIVAIPSHPQGAETGLNAVYMDAKLLCSRIGQHSKLNVGMLFSWVSEVGKGKVVPNEARGWEEGRNIADWVRSYRALTSASPTPSRR